MAILATGVIAPALQDAYALKSDIASKLAPKAFGEKTKSKLSDSEKTYKNGSQTIKKEQIKSFKKIDAEYKAKQTLKSLYRLG